MDEYVIRPAGPEHLPFLAAVERAAATLFPPGSIPDHIRADSVPLDAFEAALRRETLFVALAGSGAAVGFALLENAGELAYLAEMDVRPEHGRKGVGRALLGRVAQRARELGHDALYLTTFGHVPWNAPFYARAGFSRVPENAMPQELARILAAERSRGLENRLAMRLLL